MKTNDLHTYHGITQRDDAYGWVIQLKLMGKYRMLRTYAANAEEAARRYDMALLKLDSFTEPNARPNFPADYDTQDITSGASLEESYQDFFKELHTLFSDLCSEAESAGLDPSEMQKERHKLAKAFLESKKLKATLAYAKFLERLAKLRGAVPSLSLPAEKRDQLSDLLFKAQQIIDIQ